MGASQLGPKYIRRLSRITGLEIKRGWSHGGYVMGFVTTDHVHGWWDKKTNEWGVDDDSEVTHYVSCDEDEEFNGANQD